MKRSPTKGHDKHIGELYDVFTKISTREEARAFLADLLTPQELESIAERWQLLKRLVSGMAQRDVARELGISISKITRGSKVLRYGEGGFEKILKKLS